MPVCSAPVRFLPPRPRYPMSKILKWGGIALGAVVVLALVAAVTLYVRGSSSIAHAHTVEVSALALPTDSASIARGAHLAGIYGCTDCHGADLSGQVMGDAPPFTLIASNITPGGATADYSAEDWDRAIRHGVAADGRAMFVMPSGAYNKMSDEEAAAMIAYLQTVPAVENEHSGIVWKPMGRILAGGPISLSDYVYTATPPATSPAPDSTAAYGEYVANMMCSYCHGANLEGQMVEGGPEPILAPDLRASGQWSPEQFHETMTTGVTPAGHEMNPEVMPWTATARMTQLERESLRLYLAGLGPAPTTDA